jgi:tRNA(Ile)-lysidine synthase TilS/MesJ
MNLFELTDLMQRKGEMMRSNQLRIEAKEFINDLVDQQILQCFECGRKFDLMDEEQSSEWHYGHDCEA